ncbi:MAG TPA: NDP-sugar synthase [Solirubrobacterales bacterium]|nr:NDP-sugar synthase [Solirubrobacterales bacterium]
MQALILVGGEGTRLRPLTLTMPKPVLPLVDRPLIRYMIDWLAHHGVDDVVMACGFLAAGVHDVLGEGGDGGPRLRYVQEPEARGTAGAIKFAERFLDDRFLALNGDVLTDLDLTALMRLHEERGATATLALYPVDDPSAYGLVRREEDGEIREFLEKPEPDQIDTDEISAGAYVLERRVLDLVPEDCEVSIEREVFPKLVGHGLYGCRLDGYWTDIGTPERYLQASWDILERRARTDVGERLDEHGLLVEEDAEVASGATLTPPALIETRTQVAAGARVGARAVVGTGSEIGERAVIEQSAIHRGCRIGAEAQVRGTILAAGVEVGVGATVEPGVVVGEGARIAPGATVGEGGRVQPGEEFA